MSNQTKGHLQNQGGLRGHSVDNIYPFRIISKPSGTVPLSGKKWFHTWYVVFPWGEEFPHEFATAHEAHNCAAYAKRVWDAGIEPQVKGAASAYYELSKRGLPPCT